MNIRYPESVTSALQSGVSALSAWGIPSAGIPAWSKPLAEAGQAVAELNLRTVGALNGEVLKRMNPISASRNPAEWPAAQWQTFGELAKQYTEYNQQLGGIVARLYSALHEMGRTQLERNGAVTVASAAQTADAAVQQQEEIIASAAANVANSRARKATAE